MTLWLADRLPFLWQLLGVNYPQMRAILSVKLLLDNRRPVAAFNSWKQQEGSTQNTYWKSVGFYAVIGLFASVSLAFVPRQTILLPTVLYFGYLMAICAMTLITDFSSVVLDSADNQVMLFRPVDGRTILMARIVHITSYLLSYALAASLAGILIIAGRFGPAAGLLTLLVLLSAVLMLFLTNVFYLVLMRFTSEERLREAINYVQILMGVLFYGGFQLMPRLMSGNDPLHPGLFQWQWWAALFPPFWCAGTLDLLLNGPTNSAQWIGLGLILTTPFAGLGLMSRVLGPMFDQRLATMDIADKESASAMTPVARQAGTLANASLADRLAGWFTRSPLERAAFTIIWHLTGRDRKFKLKTYPSLAFGIIYMITMSSGGMGSNAQSYLFILYISSVYIMGAVLQVTSSDNYKAAWIYGTAPIRNPGELLSGGLKAVVVKLMIPYFVLLSIYVFYRKGPDVLPDVLLALSGTLVMVLTAALLGNRSLPFSMPTDTVSQGGAARSIVSLLIIGLVGLAHWGLSYVPYGVWAAIPVMLTIAGFMFRSYRQTNWRQIAVA